MSAICVIDGCDTKRFNVASGWCAKHYYRWRRHGSAETVLIGQKPYRVTQGGYLERKNATHPLAKRGWVADHRVALFESLGPDDHPCNWCGMTLRWQATYRDDSDALVVDHLDWNKQNNDPANLVPSCLVCNIQRAEPGRRSA